MARVPVNQLEDRNSYEFLAGLDDNGIPAWDKDIRLRKPFFNHPGLTYRSSMSWNPALDKFFLCQINYGDEPRFQGGFGIYESDQPWGPWKTVFYTREWDTGPGESMHIPVKWISQDGLSIYLIFSGEDSFSVRKMQLSENKLGRTGSYRRNSKFPSIRFMKSTLSIPSTSGYQGWRVDVQWIHRAFQRPACGLSVPLWSGRDSQRQRLQTR